jgi:hypothetical protein
VEPQRVTGVFDADGDGGRQHGIEAFNGVAELGQLLAPDLARVRVEQRDLLLARVQVASDEIARPRSSRDKLDQAAENITHGRGATTGRSGSGQNAPPAAALQPPGDDEPTPPPLRAGLANHPDPEVDHARVDDPGRALGDGAPRAPEQPYGNLAAPPGGHHLDL